MNGFPTAVVAHLASRPMRMAHHYWHTVREAWLQLDPRARAELAAGLPAHWIPRHPSMNERGDVLRNTPAGKDFLFLHRRMIRDLNADLAAQGHPPVEGWRELPQVGNAEFPVPRGPGLSPQAFPSKGDAKWTEFLDLARRTVSPHYLRSVSIDTLGTELEYGLHAAMHERFGGWAQPPSWLSRDPIHVRYDAPSFNSLFYAYSAHVHPWFWKIHGWVDARIDDWERANGVSAGGDDAWLGPLADLHNHVGEPGADPGSGRNQAGHAHTQPGAGSRHCPGQGQVPAAQSSAAQPSAGQPSGATHNHCAPHDHGTAHDHGAAHNHSGAHDHGGIHDPGGAPSPDPPHDPGRANHGSGTPHAPAGLDLPLLERAVAVIRSFGATGLYCVRLDADGTGLAPRP